MTYKKIWFVRHGESLKNIAEIHGGSGDNLTNTGQKQCLQLSKMISAKSKKNSRIVLVGHNVRQVAASMDIFASNFKCKKIFDDRIKGIHLGIANGISRDELKHKSPNDAKRLELWRENKLKINELKLTGMEQINNFKNRIVNFLESCYNNSYDTIIVICTTSVMIMVLNLIVLQKKFSYRLYRHYRVHTNDYIFISYKNGKIDINDTNINML